MNQERIHDLLASLRPQVPDFRVILTGKASRKVHGLYKPESQEILLHNRNFSTEQELLYTAVHEFAHHVHFTSSRPPKTSRAHTNEFWAVFHELLAEAKNAGWYRDLFETEPAFLELTRELKENYLKPHGDLMKEFGRLLCDAMELCRRHGVPFEDYRDRILGLPRVTAKTAMTSFRWDVPTRFGFDAMKVLTSVPQPERRQELAKRLDEGFSLDQLKREQKPEASKTEDPLVEQKSGLEARKRSLRVKIEKLQTELENLAKELRFLEQEGENDDRRKP